jgi:hypothetical protein
MKIAIKFVLVLGYVLTPSLGMAQSNVDNLILIDGSTYKTLAAALAVVSNPGTITVMPSAGIVPVSSNMTVPAGVTLEVGTARSSR